jgi:hypothetical protein
MRLNAHSGNQKYMSAEISIGSADSLRVLIDDFDVLIINHLDVRASRPETFNKLFMASVRAIYTLPAPVSILLRRNRFCSSSNYKLFCPSSWHCRSASSACICVMHWKSLLVCIGLVIATNVTYYMLLTYMPSYLSHSLHYSENHGVLIIVAIMIGMREQVPVGSMPGYSPAFPPVGSGGEPVHRHNWGSVR